MISRSRNPSVRKGSGSFSVFFLLLVFLTNLPAARAAENTTAPSLNEPSPQAVLNEVSRLRALKAQNPERYQAWIAQKKEHVAGQLEEIRSQSPRQYNRFKNQRRSYRNASADFLKKQHPDEMKRWAERRMTRVDELRQKSPDKFERLMRQHPQLQKRFETRSAQSMRPGMDRAGRPDVRQQGTARGQSRMDRRPGGMGPRQEGGRQSSQPRINKRPTGARTGVRPGSGQRGQHSGINRPNQGSRDRRGGQAARPRDRR